MKRMASITVLALSFGLLCGGCETSDPSTPKHWVDKLQSEFRKEAILKLSDMKSDEALNGLIKAIEDKRDINSIVAALYKMGDKKAIPVMLKVLQDPTEPKAGELAARALLEWEVSDQGAIYTNVAANPGTPKEQRYGALLLLAKYPDPVAETTLLQVLAGDPDLQPIILNGLAAEALGKLKSKKAIPALIDCLWLDDHLRRNQVPACRLALNRIGPPAVPLLLKTLARKNRKVEKRARKLKYHVGGLIEAKMAELLGDIPDKSAIEPLLETLKTFEEMPPSVQKDPKKAQIFVMGGVQKVISTANALAVIGDDRAVDPLIELAGSKERALEYKLTAVQQLGFLGSPKAIPGLIKLLEKEPHKADPVSQGFRVQIALNVANLMDGEDTKTMSKLEKMLTGIQKTLMGWSAEKGVSPRDVQAYKNWAGSYGKALTKLKAAAECKTNPICWGKKLGEKDSATRMMAAYRLAQSTSARDTAVKELLKFVGDSDVVVRNVVLFGLDRLGDASMIPKLQAARDVDAKNAETNKRLKGAVYTMDLMMAKLSHKKKD